MAKNFKNGQKLENGQNFFKNGEKFQKKKI